MPTLKMSKDKILTITKSGNTYEDENNAEIIKILFPQEVNNIDLSNCVVHLCMLNQDNLGDEVNISSNLKEYDDEFYTANIDITNKITYKAGEIKLWINILNSNNQMIAKTNPVTYQIKEHLDIEDYIPDQNLSLLNDFTLRMENLVDVAEEAVSKPPIAGNNGNWYVWDASIGDYKDSGISINIDLTEYVKEDDLSNTLERANEYTDKAIEETKSYVDSEIIKIPTGGGGETWELLQSHEVTEEDGELSELKITFPEGYKEYVVSLERTAPTASSNMIIYPYGKKAGGGTEATAFWDSYDGEKASHYELRFSSMELDADNYIKLEGYTYVTNQPVKGKPQTMKTSGWINIGTYGNKVSSWHSVTFKTKLNVGSKYKVWGCK